MDENVDELKRKQRAWNPKTLQRLRDKGVDLSQAHEIVNVFYVFAKHKITVLESQLICVGQEVVKTLEYEEADPPYYSVHACILLIPDLGRLDSLTDQCVELASQVGAKYDGWYTEV